MARIYVTHCCAKKATRLRGTSTLVTPDVLYTATPTQRFMARCKSRGVTWAIFSDLHGVWFPYQTHAWYNKHPKSVTPSEFQALCGDFENKLAGFGEIWFYHNPSRFHPLYARLIQTVSNSSSVKLFSHLRLI